MQKVIVYHKAGTLLIPSGPSHNQSLLHLHVICTDTCEMGKNLVVPVTTWINNLCDGTCKLGSHEHNFLQHPSYVLYRKASVQLASALQNGFQTGVFIPKENFNGQSFLRIRNGICTSPHTPRGVKVYFGCP